MTPEEKNAQWVEYGRQRQGLGPAPTQTRARRLWVNTCIGWGLAWLFLGLFIWPLLFFAIVSFVMITIPVGVRD